jgi:hypothetical protein
VGLSLVGARGRDGDGHMSAGTLVGAALAARRPEDELAGPVGEFPLAPVGLAPADDLVQHVSPYASHRYECEPSPE